MPDSTVVMKKLRTDLQVHEHRQLVPDESARENFSIPHQVQSPTGYYTRYLSATVHSSPISRFLQCSKIHVSFVLQIEKLLEHLQNIWSVTEHSRTSNHLSAPHIAHEPADMPYGASEQVTGRCSPRTIQYPCKSDECERKIWGCDGNQTEEGNRR